MDLSDESLCPPEGASLDHQSLMNRFRLAVRIQMIKSFQRFFLCSALVGLLAVSSESMWLFWLWLPYTAYRITGLYWAVKTLPLRAKRYADYYAQSSSEIG